MIIAPDVASLASRGLSLLTLGFDAIFIVQHYILYRHSRTTLLDPASPLSSSTSDEEAGRESVDGIADRVDGPEASSRAVGALAREDRENGLVEQQSTKNSQRQKVRRNDGERRPLLDSTT